MTASGAESGGTDPIRLSVCITTRNRGSVIGETLQSILEQAPSGVEVVVVDGASTDDTVAVVQGIAARYPQLRLIVPEKNSGLDADYDKAVQAARGHHCWLFSDDDRMAPGAIARVLALCSGDPLAIIVGASVHGPTFERAFAEERLPFKGERRYPAGQTPSLFRECGYHLTFIGAVVVRKEFWSSRERARFYGSEFIHCGVLFQAPLPGEVIALAEPLVQIRYGVGNWSSRAFEVWMEKWPRLVWSFDWLPESDRAAVIARHPWTDPTTLLRFRAAGQFGLEEFNRFIVRWKSSRSQLVMPFLIAATPGWLVYGAIRTALRILKPGSPTHELLDKSPYRWARPS